jgi:hypothetical protein
MICNICNSSLLIRNTENGIIHYCRSNDFRIFGHCSIFIENKEITYYIILCRKNNNDYYRIISSSEKSTFNINKKSYTFFYVIQKNQNDITTSEIILEINKYIPLQFNNNIIFPDPILEKLKMYSIFS